MKEDISIQKARNGRQRYANRVENSANESSIQGNEFSQAGKSVKMYRPPRVLEH